MSLSGRRACVTVIDGPADGRRSEHRGYTAELERTGERRPDEIGKLHLENSTTGAPMTLTALLLLCLPAVDVATTTTATTVAQNAERKTTVGGLREVMSVVEC